MLKVIPFDQLEQSDLFLDAVYEGGRNGSTSSDPLPRLLSFASQGGFRIRGSWIHSHYQMVALTSNLSDPDWPDHIDLGMGLFTYFGDNKKAGNGLHETIKGGNKFLRDIFNWGHSPDPNERRKIPPVFVFTTAGKGKSFVFRGLAVPGGNQISPTEDLVAVWKTQGDMRFQNYKAIFTLLELEDGRATRAWINDILANTPHSQNAPGSWLKWVERGSYSPLIAEPTVTYRVKEEQLPKPGSLSEQILQTIHNHYKDNPYAFEAFALEVAKLMEPRITSADLTRPWRDGGRDAVGKCRIGLDCNGIEIDFALEAKCYSPDSSVGVRETSRLISRLRHRQFGILVTTSYVHLQAYKEIKEDDHPVVIVSASDMATLLISNGYNSVEKVRQLIVSLENH